MNRELFLEKFTDVLQTEEEISFDTILDSLEEWDSLSIMATIAFLDKEFNIKTNFSEVKNFKTVEDVLKKAGI